MGVFTRYKEYERRELARRKRNKDVFKALRKTKPLKKKKKYKFNKKKFSKSIGDPFNPRKIGF